MENASKALVIAGGVLIAIIILSVGVYLYASYTRQANEYRNLVEQTEIQKFNSKFDVYLGRDNITPQEVISVVNLAREYENQVTIIVDGERISAYDSSEDFIKNNLDKIFTASYADVQYDAIGKIAQIKFNENN